MQNRGNEMSARHAGTRRWQKIINHEKDDTKMLLKPPSQFGFEQFCANDSHSSVLSTQNFWQVLSAFQLLHIHCYDT